MSFVGEIKRRKVFQVAVVYLVVAWLLVQIVATVEEPLSLPDWFDTAVIVLLAVGFPVSLVIGWAFDLTLHGMVRTSTEDEHESQPTDIEVASSSSRADVQGKVLTNSVAVLPLENLSPNPDDAYFAAGVHEEILNYLTKIKDLSVIARTSVKRYAGTDKSIAEIAAELGVGAIMEGSVRYAGDRVRVTTQLIDAATETHLWSEVYERELADVFAIQADIAAKIAVALEAEFSGAEKESIETLPTTESSGAHALYLKSLALFAQDDTALVGTAPPSRRATIQTLLSQSIDLDPEFAFPYALKAVLFAVSRIFDPIKEEDWLERCVELDETVRINAEKALALNQSIGLPHFALALNHEFNWRRSQAEEAYEQALKLMPNDSQVLSHYGSFKWLTGDFSQSIFLAKKAVALDPGNSYAHLFHAIALQAAGDHRAAADTFEAIGKTNPGAALPYLHRTTSLIALGEKDRAVEGLRICEELLPEDAIPAIHFNLAYLFALFGRREDAERIIAKFDTLIGDRYVDPAAWVWRHLAAGDTEQALHSLRRAVEEPEYRHELYVHGFLKHNSSADPVLDQPEFVELISKLGFNE